MPDRRRPRWPRTEAGTSRTRRAARVWRWLGGLRRRPRVRRLLGAGLALLFAPERGETTRRQLRRRLARLREEAETGLERAGKRTRRELQRRRRRLEAGLERAPPTEPGISWTRPGYFWSAISFDSVRGLPAVQLSMISRSGSAATSPSSFRASS